MWFVQRKIMICHFIMIYHAVYSIILPAMFYRVVPHSPVTSSVPSPKSKMPLESRNPPKKKTIFSTQNWWKEIPQHWKAHHFQLQIFGWIFGRVIDPDIFLGGGFKFIEWIWFRKSSDVTGIHSRMSKKAGMIHWFFRVDVWTINRVWFVTFFFFKSIYINIYHLPSTVWVWFTISNPLRPWETRWWLQIFFFLNFTPTTWGRTSPIFDEHIFQMGWFNHQRPMDVAEVCRPLATWFRTFWECRSGGCLEEAIPGTT